MARSKATFYKINAKKRKTKKEELKKIKRKQKK